MHYLNPAFDPVILKVNANPDPADTGGVSATYPTNKPGEGWQSHLCLKQTPSQQQALSPKLLICVSVECRRVEELISSDFFFFFFPVQELQEPNLEKSRICSLQRPGSM